MQIILQDILHLNNQSNVLDYKKFIYAKAQ